MRYLGGKSKEAKRILDVVLCGRQPDQLYVEPFVGGCNVMDKVTGPRWGNDFNWQLIEMWKAVQRGWEPPEFVSEDDYRRIREDSLGDPALHAFVACAGSWGGKWWGGYARGEGRNCIAEGRRHVLKQAPKLAGVAFSSMSYASMAIPDDSLIYCDPPYKGTTSYAKTGKWDPAAFWTWARLQAEEYHSRVFVSEFEAPEGWTCVLEFKRKNDLNRKDVIEKLFKWIPRLPAGKTND